MQKGANYKWPNDGMIVMDSHSTEEEEDILNREDTNRDTRNKVIHRYVFLWGARARVPR